MTIDELARRTGMTVRNIRAHQSRGLVPPPEVRGRTGYYGDEHLARIELIKELQADGFNLEAIRRLLEGAGGSSREVLNFSRALRAPFEDEEPEILDAEEMAERWGGQSDPELLTRGREAGDDARRCGDGPIRDPQPAAAAGRDRAGGAGHSRRRRRWRSARRCAARRAAWRGCSSSCSWRTSGSRSTAPGAPRRTGRRCARRWSACARWPPRRSWRSSSR